MTETDEDWLYRHYPKANDAEVEAFAERVAIKVESGICEIAARAEALKDMKWQRNHQATR